MLDNIKKARGKMMITQPFFATLMASTPWVETDQVPTAGTDMKNIYYNPKFFEAMPVPEVMFVIAHEVMHMALEHGLRLNGRNPTLWNMACDFATNWTLTECGMTMPKEGLIDKQYANMSAPQIYEKLIDQADKARAAGKTGNPEDGEGASGMPGLDPLHGDLQAGEPLSPAEEAKLKQTIQQKVAQAASIARMAGKVPGALEAMINEILEPQVPWPDLLRDYMLSKCKDDETWSRRNRRFGDIYLPTRHSDSASAKSTILMAILLVVVVLGTARNRQRQSEACTLPSTRGESTTGRRRGAGSGCRCA